MERIPETLDDLLDFVHPEDHSEFDLRWHKARQDRIHQQFDFRLQHVDGGYRWLLADLVLLKDNFITGVCATFIDITDRKNIELKQFAEYELVDLVVNSLHAFVAYVDCQERYQYVNRAYSEFLGKERSAFFGMTVQEVLGIAYDRVQPHLQQALQGKKVKYEVDIVGSTGLHRCGVTLVPHYGDFGSVKGVFVLAEEIGQADVLHSHYEDLERFMGHWQANPKEMCYFMGRAIARIGYRNLHDLFFATGAAYFSFREVCDRIDFIYDHWQDEISGERGKLLGELIGISSEQDVVILKDKSGKRHRGIRLMLLRDNVDGYETYSIRYFVEKDETLNGFLKEHWDAEAHGRPSFETVLQKLDVDVSGQQYEDDFTFWNFRRPAELTHGVIVYPDCQGFFDLHETKNVGDFILLTSNLLGHGKCIGQEGPLLA